MPYVYTLALEDQHYFVGVCDNMDTEMQKHREGSHSPWTNRYKLKTIITQVYYHGDSEEYVKHKMQEILCRYMLYQGVNRVRGPEEFQDHSQVYSMRDLPVLTQLIGNIMELPYDEVREMLVEQLEESGEAVNLNKDKRKWYQRLWCMKF